MSEIAKLTDRFLNQLKTNSSVNTLKAYKADLKFLENSFTSLHELNENNLKELRLILLENYSTKTIARRWSVLREFFRFCQLNNYLKHNPIADLEVDSANNIRTIKSKVKSEFIELICNHPPKGRDKALLWFLYSTGVRPSELFKYGFLKNLNLAEREFYLPNRTTFLCSAAFEHLSDYLKNRHNLTLNEPIFINDQTGQPLKEIFVYTLFTQIAESLGIQATLLDLRDSLMLRLLQSGASPDQLKYLLGFKSIKSIEPVLLLNSPNPQNHI